MSCRRCCGRARDRLSACRADSGAARRPRTRPTDVHRARTLRARWCGTGRSASAARIRARTSKARRASPEADHRRRRAARGSNRDRSPRQSRAAAAPSPRLPAPAARPAPAYSAQENSPVVRSRRATPTTLRSLSRDLGSGAWSDLGAATGETRARARRDAANPSACPGTRRGRSRV